jgi:hypothetical protein
VPRLPTTPGCGKERKSHSTTALGPVSGRLHDAVLVKTCMAAHSRLLPWLPWLPWPPIKQPLAAPVTVNRHRLGLRARPSAHQPQINASGRTAQSSHDCPLPVLATTHYSQAPYSCPSCTHATRVSSWPSWAWLAHTRTTRTTPVIHLVVANAMASTLQPRNRPPACPLTLSRPHALVPLATMPVALDTPGPLLTTPPRPLDDPRDGNANARTWQSCSRLLPRLQLDPVNHTSPLASCHGQSQRLSRAGLVSSSLDAPTHQLLASQLNPIHRIQAQLTYQASDEPVEGKPTGRHSN